MQKKRFLLLILTSLLAILQAAQVMAQSGQTATLTIMPGTISFSRQPDDFNFPQNFIPLIPQTIESYITLDPTIINNSLIIYDGDSSSGFDVTVALNDLEPTGAEDNVIHYTDVALVSLSSSLSEPVDSGSTNNPPGAPNIIAPLNCDWNPIIEPIMKNACDTSMTHFNEQIANTTLLANNVDPLDTMIIVTDGTQLSSATPATPRKIIINGDIIVYTGIVGNVLTGVSNIDQNHLTNDEVKQYYNSSNQISIMSNATITDTGTYSFGFGFKLIYNEATIPGDYNTTLTFTLIPLP